MRSEDESGGSWRKLRREESCEGIGSRDGVVWEAESGAAIVTARSAIEGALIDASSVKKVPGLR